MRSLHALTLFAAAAVGWGAGSVAVGGEEPLRKVREIYVPFDALDVLLEGQPQRVLLPRRQYEELWRKARQRPETRAPLAAAVVGADYAATVAADRVQWTGTLWIDVLEDGLQAVALDLSGVGLRRAVLDGRGAPLGRAADGPLTLFVEGRGRHELKLDMVSPLAATETRQVLALRLPRPPAARMRLSVPGDVEIQSGADVAARTVDRAANLTRFELVPRQGDTTLVMTLNSHLQRRQRVVLARSVLVDEVTEAYERIHATVSLAVLHRAVDRFRFSVPGGFEVTEVVSPLVSRWAMAAAVGTAGPPARVLEVQLREPTAGTVVLGLSALAVSPRRDRWTLARLEPLDVAGQVAVVGLLLDRRLKAESLAALGLIPIDADVLDRGLPASALRAEPGAPPLRAVAAYYAPQAGFALSARFARPPAEVRVTTNVLLVLEDKGSQVRGSFTLVPEVEKLFGFEFSVPAAWQVASVSAADKTPLAFERYGPPSEKARIGVRLPQGVPPGQAYAVEFTARADGAGLPAGGEPRALEFPVFAVSGATRDQGAIAVDARDDLVVRPEQLDLLTPLGESEKPQAGWAGVPTSLAYRYEGQPYRARLRVERTAARLTAHAYSFLRVEPDALAAHYEIVYRVERARTRQLTLSLPGDTPAALSIRGLDGLRLKEFAGRQSAGRRLWDVLLVEPRRDKLRLAVDFQQPYPAGPGDSKSLALPIVRAEGVAYQSGMAAVEGSAELEVQVATAARRLDVGELADAEYQPGRRLLGAYGFAGEPAKIEISVARPPAYWIEPAIVQKAELTTYLARDGASQTAAWFQLHAKAQYLEVRLPEGSQLWAAQIDAKPIKPQREGERLLISLPATAPHGSTALHMVYQTPVRAVGLAGRVELSAPALVLHGGRGSRPAEVPMADLAWRLYAPAGFEVVRSGGTVVAQLPSPPPAALEVLRALAGALLYSPGPIFGGAAERHSAQGLSKSAAPAAPGAAFPAEPPIAYPSQSEWAALQGKRFGGEQAPASRGEAKTTDTVLGTRIVPSPGGAGAGFGGRGSGRRDSAPVLGAKAEYKSVRGLVEQEEELSDLQTESLLKRRVSSGGRGQPGSVTVGVSAPPMLATSGKTDEKIPPAMGFGGISPHFGGNAPHLRIEEEAELSPAAQATAPKGPESDEKALAESDGRVAPDLKGAKRKASRFLAGFSSLKIDLAQEAGDRDAVTFQSLGADPRLVVTLADGRRLKLLGWALALAVALAGARLTVRRPAAKTRLIVGVVLAGTLVPLVPGLEELAAPCNLAVYTAALLIPCYLLAWAARSVFGWLRRMPVWRRPAAGAVAVVWACLAPLGDPAARAGESGPGGQGKEGRFVVQVVEPPEPVKIPDDAVILPYDPNSRTGIREADKLLVPYAEYVELWNRAYPDRKLSARRPPAEYALAGGSYSARLEDGPSLVVQGRLEIDVFAEGPVSVPFGLAGCVLSRADLDGTPARLGIAGPAPSPGTNGPPAAQGGPPAAQGGPPVPPSAPSTPSSEPPAPEKPGPDARSARTLVVLHISGKGRHVLDLTARLPLERRGGWRVVEAALPAAPAAALVLAVPQPGTEVRLGQVADRRAYETAAAEEVIDTALAPGGELSLQWRPRVAQRQVDRGLAVQSAATLDVQEDGLRLQWQLAFEFPRGQREAFRVEVPGEYLVEKVEGGNVRGWEVRPEAQRQALDVSLLKPAKDREQFTLRLWRAGAAGRGAPAEFDFPIVAVPDASLHHGQLTIRRSPRIELRSENASGVTRTDRAVPGQPAPAAAEDSPLGIRPWQAYRFASVPFSVRLAAAPLPGRVTAVVSTVLKISEYQRSLETRVALDVQDRPVYQVQVVLPRDLRLDSVTAPGDFQWAVTRRGDRPLLSVYLAAGRQGELPLVIRGALGHSGPVEQVALPSIEVLACQAQHGDIAVQLDPAFDVRATGLAGCENVLLERLFGWLTPQQRQATRLALHYGGPGYAGVLRLAPRTAVVAASTISNVRITDRGVEETILLSFNVEQAGIRRLAFLLPPWMKDCRVSVPLLRQRTIVPAGAAADSPLGVTLELQDDVMGELRVLVENDRLLGAPPQQAPIPVVQTGRTDRQFVVLENAGRDEVVVDSLRELEPLGRSQKDWQTLQAMLGGNITQAYLAHPRAAGPQLTFHTRQRTMAETAHARIRYAETRLVLDPSGTYRAGQLYKLDNQTEQFLVIELPENARLWTVWVAGEPVKPAETPRPGSARRVRIPLVKTAPGDLDYDVLLQYGGQVPGLGRLGAVDFPLVRAVNLAVEVSQARLYLPETYGWFDFGGTLRRAQAADMQNAVGHYQAKQLEELAELARQGSFGGVRAMNNLKVLAGSAGASFGESQLSYHGSTAGIPAAGPVTVFSETTDSAGKDRAANRALSASLAQQAQRELAALERAPRQAQLPDNPGRLRDLFEAQRTARARNVTKDLGVNFDDAQAQSGKESSGGKFDTRWFDQNQMAGPAQDRSNAVTDQEGTPVANLPSAAPAPTHAFSAAPSAPQGGAGAGMGGGLAPAPAVAPSNMPQVQQQAVQLPAQNRAREESGESLLDRYQAKQQKSSALALFGTGRAGGEAVSGPAAGSATTPLAVRPPTGLASLSVQLPWRGTEVLFTTPGGDVRITARAADRHSLLRLGQTSAVLAAMLLLLGLARVARRGRFRWLAGPTGSTALILAGIASLLFGVALLPGLAALAAGTTLKIRRRMRA
jgi:hypothetical protein